MDNDTHMNSSNLPASTTSPIGFLSLPVELHTQIFDYVFASPYGSVTLSRTFYHWTPIRYRIFTCGPSSFEIGLSILRTCKAIYAGGRNSLWNNNVLDIEAFMHEHSQAGDSINKLPARIKTQIKGVVLNINLLDARTTHLPNGGEGLILERIFHELADIAALGNLRSITLNARDTFSYSPGTLRHFDLLEIMDVRRHGLPPPQPQAHGVGRLLFQEYVSLLSHAVRESSFLSKMKRQFVINTDNPVFTRPLGCPSRSIKRNNGNPNALFNELNTAWGGELVVNGDVVLRDGALVGTEAFEHFTSKASEGKKWFYTRDLECWRAAQWWSLKHPSNVLKLLDQIQIDEAGTFEREMRNAWRARDRSEDEADFV